MFKYKVLKNKKDYFFLREDLTNIKGSRKKRVIVDLRKRKIRTGFFKYEMYECTEACSEKLACEIAKVLKIKTAQIEFAKDENGTLGIISYLFSSSQNTHTDAKAFFNKNDFDRKKFCTIDNIKSFMDKYTINGFEAFIEMMVFDSLVGETDRHEENWGLLKKGMGKYEMSPLYDSGCNLLRQFKDRKIAQPYYNNEKKLEDFAQKSKTCIYKDDGNGRYKHFELIEKLIKEYPEITKEKIKKLNRLKNWKIKMILNKLPNGIIEDIHKEHIYKYIIIRKNILLEFLEKGEK